VEDCAGVCGGSSVLVTLCEDTDGDGLGNPGTETEECVAGGRDITDGCELPDFNLYLTDAGEVFYQSSEAISGFQFNVDGTTVASASGGDAAAAGMFVQAQGSLVLAFFIGGGELSAGCGTLINLTLDGDATGMSGIVVSDPNGGALPFVYYVEAAGPDMVADCSDMYPDCFENYVDCNDECAGSAVEDCAGECGGSAVEDECGVCGGDGIPDGECDCNGNVEDCAGECGGSSVIVTLCEDTDGDGYGNPGSETEECVDGGRDITDGCELPDFNLYLTDSGEVFYQSSVAISGFQFNVDGTTVAREL
jgi:hypothetical protein